MNDPKKPQILTDEECRAIAGSAHSTSELSYRYDVSSSTIRRAKRWVRSQKQDELPEPEVINPEDVKAIWTPNTIALQLPDRESRIISNDHSSFEKILELIKEEEYLKAYTMMDIKECILTFSDGRVEVKDDTLFIDGKDVGDTQSSLVTKLLQMLKENDHRISNLVKFIDHVYENPSAKVVNQIYNFIAAEDIEIDELGMIIAWKSVRSDYYDHHSRTFLNTIGSVISMPRNEVMDDENVTCAAGLHVCSKKYFTFLFGGSNNRFMKVAVNPKDVVSIPVDHDDAKMRCCKYVVIDEVENL